MAPAERHGRAYVAFALLTLLVVPFYHTIQVDDPYITYRYARNLAEHGRLVYNLDESVLGTTSPLFAVLLALPGQFTQRYDIATSAVNGAALAALAALLYWILNHGGHRRAGLTAGILVILSPLMGDALGFELNLYLALVFGGFAAVLARRLTLAGVLFGLAILTRGDGLVPAGLILGHLLLTEPRRAVRPVVLCGSIVLAWSAVATLTYGSPFPNTLSAKQAMGDSALFRSFPRGSARIAWIYVTHSPLYLAFIPAAIAGLVRLRRMDARLWLLLAWPALIALAYTVMEIPSAYNYVAAWVPQVMPLSALGLDEVASRLSDGKLETRHRRWASWPIALAPLIAAQSPRTSSTGTPVFPRATKLYRDAGEWLAENTPEDARIALVEIGIVGFYSDRPLIDMVGLVTPSVAPHLARGDIAWSVRTHRPEYVLLHDPPWPALETPVSESDWFRDDYRAERAFAGREPYRLVAYRRVADR